MEGDEFESVAKAKVRDRLHAFYPHLEESTALSAAEAMRQYVELAQEIVASQDALTASREESNVKAGAVDPSTLKKNG